MKHPTVCALAAALLWPALAQAHMKLMFPPSRVVENGQGDPQKGNGPCASGTPSKVRTKFKPGQTITVTWKETVHHPGHFRISFDDDGEDAFQDPKDAKDIVDPPAMPILKDGLFPNHTENQAMQAQITLPNVTCKTCTLQVIQAMLQGGDVSMYYHCADIELTNDAPGGEGGTPPSVSVDAGSGTPGSGGVAGTGGAGGAGGYGGTGGAATGGTGYPDPSTGGTGGTAPVTGGSSGSTPGTGGAGAPISGTGGTGAPTPTAPPADAGSQSQSLSGTFAGCAVAGRARGGVPVAFVAFTALLLVRSRRRRTRRS
jgi:hypothetical protein